MEDKIYSVLEKYGINEPKASAITEDLLVLCAVSQQRELLEWLSNEDYFNIPKDEISEILEDWKTYNSNCG